MSQDSCDEWGDEWCDECRMYGHQSMHQERSTLLAEIESQKECVADLENELLDAREYLSRLERFASKYSLTATMGVIWAAEEEAG